MGDRQHPAQVNLAQGMNVVKRFNRLSIALALIRAGVDAAQPVTTITAHKNPACGSCKKYVC
ncbi:MAG: hypothetical protein AAB278_02620 [Pseudomonadota bacterium]